MNEEPAPATRSVLCEAHGLRYDPMVTAGCVRCRREAPATASRRPKSSAKTSLGLPLLALLILLVAVLWMVLGENPISAIAHWGEDAIENQEVIQPPDPSDSELAPLAETVNEKAEDVREAQRLHQERVEEYEKIRNLN